MKLADCKLGMPGVTLKLLFLLAIVVIAGSLPTGSGAVANASYVLQYFSCDSDGNRYRFCPANTNRGVRLVRVKSDASCIQGRSWGYDRRGIWVKDGCRADFELGGVRGRPGRGPGGSSRGGSKQIFYCESGDGKRHYCAEGKVGKVRLVRRRGKTPCIEGRTWGRDQSGFYVDNGCSADFEVTLR
jgi:Protein of unknown function (DUF3011)